jgi:mono/diheme cytochrome c family protein
MLSRWLLVAVWLVPACAGQRVPAEQWTLARAAEPSGAKVYDAECGSCHGVDGDGARGIPELMGQDALPLQRRGRQGAVAFKTVRDVFDYTREKMPLPSKRAGTLSEREYWEVVSFLVRGRGASLAVTPANASSIVIN